MPPARAVILPLLFAAACRPAGAAARRALGRTVTLRGGVEMPTLGLGSSGGGKGCADPSGDEAARCGNYNATMSALGLGYRAFHEALSYCSQAGLGAALHDAVSSGMVTRGDIFIMSMVPKYLMGYNLTRRAVSASLAQLRVEQIDLVMVHHRAADWSDWPRSACQMAAFPDAPAGGYGPPPCAVDDPTWLTCQDETWRALLDLKREGVLRAVGVSNWRTENLRRMARLGQELPAVNQVEAHVGWHDDELIEWSQQHGVVTQAATPLGRSMPALVKPGKDPLISSLANKYGVTPAQVSLRWLLDIGVAAIPSTTSAAYQRENIGVHDFALQDNETRAVALLRPTCRGSQSLGLAKCWADPATMMCMWGNGSSFHCP